ncbi:hypothetical protein ACXVUM_09165 [Williamsia sp. SKLECPSW1]
MRVDEDGGVSESEARMRLPERADRRDPIRRDRHGMAHSVVGDLRRIQPGWGGSIAAKSVPLSKPAS